MPARLCLALLIVAVNAAVLAGSTTQSAKPRSLTDTATTQPTEAPRAIRPLRRVGPSPMERLAGRTTQPDSAAGRGTVPFLPTTQKREGPLSTSQPDPTANLPLVERAALRLKLGRYDLAEKDFNEMLKDGQPESNRLAGAVGLSEICRRTGRYAESAKALERVGQAEAGTTRPEAVKSADWRLAKAELVARIGQYEEALALARDVLADQPENWHARWIAGQQLETLGQTEQAKEVYQAAERLLAQERPTTARSVEPGEAVARTYAGLILDRYSMLIANPVQYATKILQDFYQTAYEDIDRQYWPARVAAGNLSLAKYKTAQAAEDYLAALKINPAAYEANIGLGWAYLADWRFENVDAQLAAARKVNAKDPAVRELEAALHMMERKYEEAARSAMAGLATNPRHLDCLGLLAAANLRLGRQDQVKELAARAERVNPRPAGFFHILGEWQSAARQFDSAEAYYLKAIELAPWDPNARTSLGMMYMQTGHEDKARKVLEESFAIDKFNRRSFNTLQLLDQLVAFDSLDSPHFTVKFNRGADAILGPYFRDYLEGIYAELSRDYEVELPRKSIVEIFPDHAQFSVRTTGKPWIPTVGACTGWVVAMYSPRRMAGTARGFNWAHVLRHEFTHVVTLAATENRIPHWMTEGLAVHQEPGPRKWKWVQLLSIKLRLNQLFGVEQIDWGFIRPKRPDDRETAYAQSEWMVEFIIDQYGYRKINELLKAFRDYKTQSQALRELLGVSESQFNDQFRAWARKQVVEDWKMPADPIIPSAQALKDVQARPEDAAARAGLAVAYYYERNLPKAEEEARRALRLDPDQTRALALLGSILAAQNKWPEAEKLLRRLADLDATASTAPRLLAQQSLAAGQKDQAILWFNRLKLACPQDPASSIGLAAIHLDRREIEKALPHLADLAEREASDPKYAVQLASLYTRLGKPDQAAVWLNQAMHIDPFNPAYHEQLAAAYGDDKLADQAIAEIKVAIQLKPDEARYWHRLAQLYDADGKSELARKAAQFAVKLDPNSPAREMLARPHPGQSDAGRDVGGLDRLAPATRPATQDN